MEMQDSLEKLDIDIMKGYEKEIYDLIVPLGESCQVAYQLERLGLRFTSLPFDWLFSLDTNKVIEAIESGFKDWLCKKNLVEEKPTQTGHLKIIDKKYGTIHQHIFPLNEPWEKSYKEVKTIVDRRVKRLLSFANKKILFVRTNMNLEEAECLEKALIRRFGQGIHLLVLNHTNNFEIQEINHSLKFTSVYEIYHESEGLKADWRGYNKHWDYIFSNIKLKTEFIDFAREDYFEGFWPCEEESSKKKFRWTKQESLLDLSKYIGCNCVLKFTAPILCRVFLLNANAELLEVLDIKNIKDYSFDISYMTRFITIKVDSVWSPKDVFATSDERKLGICLKSVKISRK